MRRADREITDQEHLRELILACDCCRLAISCEDGPYIVPLNFGYEERDGHGRIPADGGAEGQTACSA